MTTQKLNDRIETAEIVERLLRNKAHNENRSLTQDERGVIEYYQDDKERACRMLGVVTRRKGA